MQKSIFPTKIKDGLFVLTVALVVMGGSLYVDAVKGVLRGEKVHVMVYLEGTTVDEQLTAGNMVTAYRRTVGKIEEVGFFTAEVQHPSEIGKVKLEELAATPEQMKKLQVLQKELAVTTEIVNGVKLDVTLYKEMFGPMWPLFGEKSDAKVAASGMLGEPYLQLYPGAGSGGMKDGERLNFPKNDPALGPGTPLWAKELVSGEEVAAAQERLTARSAKQAEFERVLQQIAENNAKAEENEPSAKPAPPTVKSKPARESTTAAPVVTRPASAPGSPATSAASFAPAAPATSTTTR